MKDVAIFTFVKVFNYGAELQAFALSKIIGVLGREVEVLDCSIKDISIRGFANKRYRESIKIKFKNLLFRVFVFGLSICYNERAKTRKQRFMSFCSDYIPFSKNKIKSFIELYKTQIPYSTIVVGSDQVWNYSYPFSPEPYLLTFAGENVKKISYAASIGKMEIPSQVSQLYYQAISNFSAVSVREKSAVSVLKNIGIDSVEVLDPTLLLDKEEWRKYLSIKENKSRSPYLVVYELLKSNEILNVAKRIAKQNNLKIIYITSQVFSFRKVRDITYVYDAGPKEFVELFLNASFVLTTSFHGTAFAVNFKIPFYSFIETKRSMNARIIDLLSELGLSDRIIVDNQIPVVLNSSVDFYNAHIKLSDKKIFSLDYLKNALN